MPSGYLVLASERRVLAVTFDNDLHAIQRTIGCQTIEHGTTFATEDQLIITGDEAEHMPKHWFNVAGVPFPLSGVALLIGVNQSDGDTADHPAMSIDEFRTLITVVDSAQVKRSEMAEAMNAPPRHALPTPEELEMEPQTPEQVIEYELMTDEQRRIAYPDDDIARQFPDWYR
jgi:hypothetical protein